MNGLSILVVVIISISYYGTVLAWDNIDLELFDLVEDVRTNFYEVLGVPQVSVDVNNSLNCYNKVLQ